MRAVTALACAGALSAAPARAQSPDSVAVDTTSSPPVVEAPSLPETPSGPVQTGNLLNPNTSVIGWIQGSAGNDPTWTDQAALLKEAELGFQAVVDPYSRADFFISFHDLEAPELEEGYLTLLTLPGGLQARLGKFRNTFGKFNVTHPGETPFADRPLAAVAYLGEDGLASTGAELSWLPPLPVFVQLAGEVERAPDESSGAFGPGRDRGDLLYVGRAQAYTDLSEAWNATFGLSVARGPRELPDGLAEALPDTSEPRSTVAGVDLTLRWKNRRRAIYRSLVWQTEAYRRVEDRIPPICTGNVCETFGNQPEGAHCGGFSYVDYQFARRWHTGVRGDYVQIYRQPEGSPFAGDFYQAGALAFLTFTPSEFSLVSLQARRERLPEGGAATEAFLKVTFNVGPHGAHPFF